MQVLNSAIHHHSNTQYILATRSGESELHALGSATADALHLRTCLLEGDFATRVRITIHTDRTTSTYIATRHGATKSTRHIQLRHLFVQDLVTSGSIQIRKIACTYHPSDILTKLVKAEALQRLLHRVGVLQVPHCIANPYIGSKYKDLKKIELANYQNTAKANATYTKNMITTIDTTKSTYAIWLHHQH